MTKRWHALPAILAICTLLAASCAPQVPVATTAPTAVPPTATPLPATPTAVPATPTSAPATPTAGSSSQKVDLDKVFPPGEGRDLVLTNCVACHSFVCAVKGQRPAGHWETIKIGHRDKTPALSDSDYDALFAYLVANYNDTTPEPELPEALLKIGCNVQ